MSKVEPIYEPVLPCQGKRVPLPIRELGAVDENVLPGAGLGLFLLDLELHHFRRVLDNLGKIGDVARAHFTENTLINPDNPAYDPVPLQAQISSRSPG
jgi:hypothetical protein